MNLCLGAPEDIDVVAFVEGDVDGDEDDDLTVANIAWTLLAIGFALKIRS